MHPDEFEAKMRQFENLHSLKVLPNTYPIIRVDGRGFSKLTNKIFDKPFSTVFHDIMVKTATDLMVELGGMYTFTESDEISVLLPEDTILFSREVEKLVSISAAIATAQFNKYLTAIVGGISTANFDSRIITAPTIQVVRDYFSWRQADASRCGLNGATFWGLVHSGKTERQAAKLLEKAGDSKKHDILHSLGINFAKLPGWQKNGTGIWYDTVERDGFNPKTGKTVTVQRREVYICETLPIRDDYRKLIEMIIKEKNDYEKSKREDS